jgi:UDPglucose--hexose-1-phosphate uridylyltransferase
MNPQEQRYRLLKDNLSASQIIISPGRFLRPKDSAKKASAECPFCPAAEHLTPPTLFQLPREGNWQVRVFRNLFPLVSPDEADDAYGIHEVIVETPQHDVCFHRLPIRAISRVMYAIRERMKLHSTNERLQTLITFRNQGLRGGASLAHPHTQLVGLSWVPPGLMTQSQAFVDMAEKGYCPLCLDPTDPLIVAEEGSFRAFSPPAPRFPRETWIAPCRHEPALSNLKDTELDDLSALLKKLLSALAKITSPKDLDYNLVFHTEPLNDERGTFHTHIEILPRPEALAGFEMGGGLFVNPIAPQQSVSELRQVLLTTQG